MPDPVYSREQVETFQKHLTTIAKLPRTSFTKKQVVEELIESIEKALEVRSYREVAEALKEKGLDIAPGSLKQYVNAYRRAHSSKSKRQRSPAKKASSAGQSKEAVNNRPGSQEKQTRRTKVKQSRKTTASKK